MPTCTNQAGWNAAQSALNYAVAAFNIQCSLNLIQAAQGNPPPGMNAQGMTPTMCYSFTGECYTYALGRSPSQAEAQLWAEALYGNAFTAGQMAGAFLNSSECYTRFGCS